MRIIAGELRGRRIEAPPGRTTRPMLDRVREALFSTLLPWIPEARVLDLYAGSGSLGLEAFSRGAAFLRLVEEDPAVLRILERNISALGLDERVEIVRGDAMDPHAWCPNGSLNDPEGEPGFDVVLFDPPYATMRDPEGRRHVMERLDQLARTALADEGVIVLHTPRGLSSSGDWSPDLVVRERDYGTNALFYIQVESESGTGSGTGGSA